MEQLNLGLEYGFKKFQRQAFFLYHADAVIGIGKAWNEGFFTFPELAARLQLACSCSGERESQKALETMVNYSAVNLWDRIFGR